MKKISMKYLPIIVFICLFIANFSIVSVQARFEGFNSLVSGEILHVKQRSSTNSDGLHIRDALKELTGQTPQLTDNRSLRNLSLSSEMLSLSTPDVPELLADGLDYADGFDYPVGKPDGIGYNPNATYTSTESIAGCEWLQTSYNGSNYVCGPNHPGVDFNLNRDGTGDNDRYDPVYAIANGIVITSSDFTYTGYAWGNIILIAHFLPDGAVVWSQYAHLERRDKFIGDIVKKGNQIGTIGKGARNAYPAHLHFEIRTKNLKAYFWPPANSWTVSDVKQNYTDPFKYINDHRTIEIKDPGDVEGVVLGKYGNRVSSAPVLLFRPVWPFVPLWASTDGQGTYKFTNIPPGYAIMAAIGEGLWGFTIINVSDTHGTSAPDILLCKECTSQTSAPNGDVETAGGLVCSKSPPQPPPSTPPPPPTATCDRSKPGVILYSEKDYAGKCSYLVGSHSNLGQLAVGNDSVSSIYINGNYKVRLFEDVNYAGRYDRLSSSDPNLDIRSLGEQYSSVEITQASGCQDESADGVFLYSDKEFKGSCVRLVASVSNLASTAVGDNEVSSVRIRGNFGIRLYEDTNFGGRSEPFGSDDSNLDDHSLGEQWSSVKVTSEVYCADTSQPGVYLYSGKDFGANCYHTVEDVTSLRDTAIGDNKLRSIKIVGPFWVKAYEDVNFGGRTDEFWHNETNLTSRSLGDQYSSIRVHRVNTKPNSPLLLSPVNSAIVDANQTPRLCWQSGGDVDGDALEFQAQLRSGSQVWTSEWQPPTQTCWQAPVSDAGIYQWEVHARDLEPKVSDWSALFSFSIDAVTEPLVLNAVQGNQNIYLDWNPVNNARVARYRLSRSVREQSNFSVIATTNETFYYDTTGLSNGTTYCYWVEALREDNSLVTSSTVACALKGELALWVPNTLAKPGDRLVVPVNIKNASGLRIDASDIWLDYDPLAFNVVSVSKTALTDNYEWAYSVQDSGDSKRVRISSFSTDPPTLQGVGSLFWLTIQVTENAGFTSTLDLREFISGVGGSSIYTPEDLYHSVPLLLEDGVYFTEDNNPYLLGDLNNNGVVEAADASLALRIANGKVKATPRQLHVGDVNGDGKIDAADASMILHYATTGAWATPLKLNAFRTETTTPTLSIDSASVTPGSIETVSLRLYGLSQWAGGEFWIAYQPDLVDQVIAVSTTDLTNLFELNYSENPPGMLHILMSSDTPINSDGEIVKITFQVADDALTGSQSPLAIADAAFNDIAGRDYATSEIQQVIDRLNGTLTILWRSLFLPVVLR